MARPISAVLRLRNTASKKRRNGGECRLDRIDSVRFTTEPTGRYSIFYLAAYLPSYHEKAIKAL